MADELEPTILKSFDKCPWCGSTERMMGKLGEELKEKGSIRADMNVGLKEIGGPIIDPGVTSMLVGGLIPAHFALQDICMGCGREITVHIERKMVAIGLAPTQQLK